MSKTIFFSHLALLTAFVGALPAEEKVPLHEHPTLVAMWKQNNAWRAAVKLPPQKMNPALTKAAQEQAWYMAEHEELSHTSNGGLIARVDKAGYKYRSLAENIAHNQRSVKEVFESWKDSPGHWANMASQETEMGCGFAISATGEAYWVVVYGTPQAEIPPHTTTAP